VPQVTAFSPNRLAPFQLAERPFGDDNDRAPDRIRRGDRDSLFRIPVFLNQSTTPQNEAVGQTRHMEWNMAKADQLAKLMLFLLLGYFALTVAAAFAFTFVW
jgi:hypothetical protein